MKEQTRLLIVQGLLIGVPSNDTVSPQEIGVTANAMNAVAILGGRIEANLQSAVARDSRQEILNALEAKQRQLKFIEACEEFDRASNYGKIFDS